MTFVSTIMRSPVLVVPPDMSVRQAAAMMSSHGVGCLVVVEEDVVKGILTSRDVREAHPNRLVADTMSRPVVSVPDSASVQQVWEVMTANRIEHLPVVDDGQRLKGIVTATDVLLDLRFLDSVTGLRTADFLRRKGADLLAQQEVAVLFVDLDRFGEINKQRGHVFGDRCLQFLAERLLAHTDPAVDDVCRYGGDEFAILTTRSMPQAYQLAVQLLAAVQEEAASQGLPISFTVGIAGGRRRSVRGRDHAAATLDDMINLASRYSTQAKGSQKRILPHPDLEESEAAQASFVERLEDVKLY